MRSVRLQEVLGRVSLLDPIDHADECALGLALARGRKLHRQRSAGGSVRLHRHDPSAAEHRVMQEPAEDADEPGQDAEPMDDLDTLGQVAELTPTRAKPYPHGSTFTADGPVEVVLVAMHPVTLRK